MRAGGGFPRGHCPEATPAGQSHIPALHIHNHCTPATLDPRLVFPAYRGNTNNPEALGKASGLGSCLFISSVRKALLQPPRQRAGFGMVGLQQSRDPTSDVPQPPDTTTAFINKWLRQGWRRLKECIAGARDSEPLLAGFEKAHGEQLVRLQPLEWLQRKPNHELLLLHSSTSWPRF